MISKLTKKSGFHSWGRWEAPKAVSGDSGPFRVLVKDVISCALPRVRCTERAQIHLGGVQESFGGN